MTSSIAALPPAVTASPSSARAVSAESSLASTEMGAAISIMGVPFDHVTTAHTLALIQRMIESRQPHYIATANVDFLVQAQSDAELRRILLDAHLVLCDGAPLVWASKWLGNKLPERVAGSDLVPLMLRLAAERGYRVFLLGAAEEINRKAAENIEKQFPGLKVAGRYSPPLAPLDKMNHAEIRQRIKSAHPDIVLVAFGCPKQEKWIDLNYVELGVPVCVGVGATVDFLAGAVRRAPVWMRKCGLEWSWRLIMEPRRLARRYGKGFVVFGQGLLSQLWNTAPPAIKTRIPSATTPASAPVPLAASAAPIAEEPARSIPTTPEATAPMKPAPEMNVLAMPERLDAAAVNEYRANWEAQPLHAPLIIDLAKTEFLDSTGLGFLIKLRRMARENGAKFALANVSPSIHRTIALMKLTSMFTIGSSVEDALYRAA